MISEASTTFCKESDPLMPMLFSLGQHAALTATSDRLWESERLLAFFDDLYVVTTNP